VLQAGADQKGGALIQTSEWYLDERLRGVDGATHFVEAARALADARRMATGDDRARL